MRESRTTFRSLVNMIGAMVTIGLVFILMTAARADGVPCNQSEGGCHQYCTIVLDPDTFACCSTFGIQCCDRMCFRYACAGSPTYCANTVVTGSGAGTPGSGSCIGNECQ